MFKMWIHWLVMVHIDLYIEEYGIVVPELPEIDWAVESELSLIISSIWETVDPTINAQ